MFSKTLAARNGKIAIADLVRVRNELGTASAAAVLESPMEDGFATPIKTGNAGTLRARRQPMQRATGADTALQTTSAFINTAQIAVRLNAARRS